MRTLDQIEEDLHMCAEYRRIGTVQAALNGLEDIRRDMIDLVQQVRELQNSEGRIPRDADE